MSEIMQLHAREVFDSRGRPTVEVELETKAGGRGRAIVPSGASTGQFEAVELRDRGEARLGGQSVATAVANVNTEIASTVVGLDADDQRRLDRQLCELDGTENKSRLGANAILGVSLAAAHAAAAERGVMLFEHLHTLWNQLPPTSPNSDEQSIAASPNAPRLPMPMINMISGGLHAGGNLDFQDFLIIPLGAKTFRQAVEWSIAVYQSLGRLLIQNGYEGHLVGDEGGYGPRLSGHEEAAQLVVTAIDAAGLQPGTDVAIALDVAASHFCENGHYRLTAEQGRTVSADRLIEMLEDLVDRFPIISIEDALIDDDWDGWRRLTQRLGQRVQLVGDDLFVTNRRRLQQGIDSGVANSVLIKVNQVGTLWETLETMRLAVDSGYRPVVSARSGETEDTTIADLAVATAAGQIKIGSVARSERLCKYNQLLRLEEHLGDQPPFVAASMFEHPQ